MAIRNLGLTATIPEQRAYAYGWRTGYRDVSPTQCPPHHKEAESFWNAGYQDGEETRRVAMSQGVAQ